MVKTQPSRYPSRGTTEPKTLHHILDQGLFCTIAYVHEDIPHQIPTGFCRDENHLYIHGSAKSHFINQICDQVVSYSVSIIDALVLAPTAFDHSFNYRSVIGYGAAREVTSPEAKQKVFNIFTERYIPGRVADVGEPTHEQMNATKIIKISLDNAAAKVREGDVNTKIDAEDAWCGIIPVNSTYGDPIRDGQLPDDLEVPQYIRELLKSQ